MATKKKNNSSSSDNSDNSSDVSKPRKKRSTKSSSMKNDEPSMVSFSLKNSTGSAVERLVRMELKKDPYRYVPAVSEVELEAWDTPLAHDRILQGCSIGLRMFNFSRMRKERGEKKPTMAEVEQSMDLAEAAREWGHEARDNIDNIKIGMKDLFCETAIWIESGSWSAAKDALWRLRGLMNLMINYKGTHDFEEWGERQQEEWAEALAFGVETERLFEESIIDGIQHSIMKTLN